MGWLSYVELILMGPMIKLKVSGMVDDLLMVVELLLEVLAQHLGWWIPMVEGKSNGRNHPKG